MWHNDIFRQRSKITKRPVEEVLEKIEKREAVSNKWE